MMKVNVPFGKLTGPATSAAYKTGSWRTERPEYVALLPPCSAACPAGEEIHQWLYAAQGAGEGYEQAWRTLVARNPFPAIMGRICYHPCQTACNRAELDTEVGINSVEQFLGDLALREGWKLPLPKAESGKRVLIVGSGPAGLSAAYHLRLLGHTVVVREAQPEPGGMMRWGIPAYRLPRNILQAEVDRIVATGVQIVCDSPVTDLDEATAGFDAVVLTIGAGVGSHVNIPAVGAAKIMDAISLLHEAAEGEKPLLGRRVAVYGGGNTAMDAARTARRLGADETVIVYRRTAAQMPAHQEEYLDAVAEGVSVRWLSTITEVGDGGTIRIEKMELDETGRPHGTGEFEELQADAVVLAVGQDVDLSLVEKDPAIAVTNGVIDVNSAMMTGKAGVFAAGDAAPGDRTATVAIGRGRIAAQHVDAWLGGRTYGTPSRDNQVPFARLNTWYYSDAPAETRQTLDAARRITGFEEIVKPLSAQSALFEAQRCMSCGNCFECDNCFGLCPDDAIIKLGPGLKYQIDLDYCKGCGVCVHECPAGAISMVPEAR
jgi:2-oxoacid:acceptor oxidoreductase delta subunit (pyruvate/2-ketoisovalerate family)